jgi:ABC-2 type transport system ATP-binding protein
MSVLQVNKLFKSYGDTNAVNDVSFSVARGEIVGLLGPNGAGKTTTINMILGVLEPTNGKIVIDGTDISEERSRALARTNFAAVYAAVPGNLTVYQNLRVFGLLYGVQNLKKRIAEVIQEYDLGRFVNAKAGVLSSGEQTRVALAKAMLNKPALLLLDEPTASLDPATAREVRERIKNYAHSGQGGILWTSHNMHEVTETCDRVLFVSHGKILLEGDPKKLPAEYGKKDLEELFIAVAREPLSLTE